MYVPYHEKVKIWLNDLRLYMIYLSKMILPNLAFKIIQQITLTPVNKYSYAIISQNTNLYHTYTQICNFFFYFITFCTFKIKDVLDKL